MAKEPKPQEQQQRDVQEQHLREQRRRERLERLAQPRKSEQEILAERAELPKSERFKRRMERLQLVRGATETQRVRVHPRDEAIRKAFKNPPGRIGFRDTGSVEWPLDQFTKRRLRDGSITIELEQRAEPQQVEAPQEARATRNQPPTPPTS